MTTMKRAVTLATLLLAGCSVSPKSIDPVAYADPALAAATCADIAGRLATAEASLLTVTKIQGEKRARGAGEIWAFGITSNVFSQDEEKARIADIGRLKGESAALRAEAATKGCAVPEQHKILRRTA